MKVLTCLKMSTARVTEEERYRICAAVHMWDLEHGGKQRDWEKIADLAEVVKLHELK